MDELNPIHFFRYIKLKIYFTDEKPKRETSAHRQYQPEQRKAIFQKTPFQSKK